MLFSYAIGSVLLVSVMSLVGLFTISLKESVLRKYVFLLVSLAIGALLGDAFLHLIPEAFEQSGNPSLVGMGIIAGIVVFFAIERIIHWHCHHLNHDNQMCVENHPLGKMILLADGTHNFIDGLIIGASYMAGVEIGIATTIAVILHEIPQEIADFGVLIHSGYSTAKALWLNFLSALTSVVGALVAFFLGQTVESFSLALLPIAAGGFIYIALSDLIPELHKNKLGGHSFAQFGAILVGIASMLLLIVLE